jgi:hypothetical protein
MNILSRVLITILFILHVSSSWAQHFYPVQVRPVIRTASVFLADYEDPSNFLVQVKLNDVTVPSYQIRLKITIKKDDQEITSNSGILLDLVGGQTYILNTADLKELLKPSDLTYKNIAFENDKPRTLSPGAYHISFEAFDAKAGIKVSNAATDFVRALVEMNDPPLLNLPNNNNQVEIGAAGQNIFFSWTPRNFFSLPSVQIKYRLRIVKVEPVDRNPYEVMNTGVFQIGNAPYDNLDYTSFIYDRSFLPLEQGAVYAWQVQAYELVNENGKLTESSQRFRNNGFSEVYSFSIKENCEPVIIETPVTDTVSPGAPLIVLHWNNNDSHTLYEVKYRPAGTILPWSIVNLSENELKLGSTELEKDKRYEYTVAAQCKNWQRPVYGGTFELKSPDCAAPDPIYIVSNNSSGIKLRWDASKNADAYNITFKHSDETTPATISRITGLEYTLPPAISGSYTLKIDGICGTDTASGNPDTISYNDTEIVGGCPLPAPFRFTVTPAADQSKENSADAIWTSLPVHENFELSYHHRDSTNTWTYTDSVPQIRNIQAKTGQLYQYTLRYTCKGGKTVTAPAGWFRLDAISDTATNVTPGTADCFPPAFTSAEAKNNTTGRFEWQKVNGADEYQVFYALQGTQDFKIFTSTAAEARITDMIASGKYDYKVRCRCGGDYSIFSQTGFLDLGKVSDGSCDSVAWFKVLKTTPTEVQLTWKFDTTKTGYILTYKENSQAWTQKYTENLSNIEDVKTKYLTGDSIKFTLINLAPSTKYNFKIQGICGLKEAAANDPVTGETLTDKLDEKDCSNPNECDRTITTPIDNVEIGDTLQVADYKMVIKTVESAGSGLWKGTAVAEAPFIGFSENIKFNASFDKLSVNNKSCVLKGDIKIDSASVYILDEETRNKIKSGMDQVDKLLNLANQATSNAGDILNQASQYGHDGLDYFQGGGNQGQVKTGGLGEQITSEKSLSPGMLSVSGGKVVIDGTATTQNAPALVKDKEGKVFSVATDGEAVLVGQYDAAFARMDTVGVSKSTYLVEFNANKDAVYAFDKYIPRYGEREAMAPHYLKRGTEFFSAKAIVPSVVDYVDFSISGSEFSKSDVSFVNREGFVFERSGNTVTLAGGPSSDAQEVFAVVTKDGKKQVIGALLLASYEPKNRKVIIIPVQLSSGLGRDVKDIEKQLNKAYAPVGITYTVEEDASFKTNSDWCSAPNCKFKPSGSALLSNNYTDDEKAVKEAYIEFKGKDNLDKDAAYIFAIGEAVINTGDEPLQGKMNFAEQFGFLYNVVKYDEEQLGRTLAHELGHGNYKLYHTWEKMYLDEGTKGTTYNVMDKKEDDKSVLFNKVQWDIIHQPGVTWGIFTKDDDQEMQEITNISELKDFKNSNNTFTFVAPSGKPVTVPGTIKSVMFFDEEDVVSTSEGNLHPYGALYGFTTEDGKKYTGTKAGNEFIGYRTVIADPSTTYYDSYSASNPSGNYVITGETVIKNGALHFNVRKVEYDASYLPWDNGWIDPSTSKYFAKGPLTNVLNIESWNLKKEKLFVITQLPSNPEQKSYLSINNNESAPDHILAHLKVYNFIKNNPGVYSDFMDCKGDDYSLNYSDYYRANVNYTPGVTNPTYSGNYPGYITGFISAMTAFKNGSGRSGYTTWYNQIIPLINTAESSVTSTTQSKLAAKLKEAKCLDRNLQDAIGSLTVQQRIDALQILSVSNMKGSWFGVADDEEGAVFLLFKYIKNTDISNFLEKLETTNGIGAYSSENLMHRIVSGTDGDNYAELMKIIVQKILASSDLDTRLADATHPDNFVKRTMVWEMPGSSSKGRGIGYIRVKAGVISDYIDFQENGNIEITFQKVTDTYTKYCAGSNPMGGGSYPCGVDYIWQDVSPKLIVKPFDLIFLHSSTYMEEINAVKGENTFIPAIVLKYSNDKIFNKNVTDAIDYTLDAVTLVASAGTVTAVKNLTKLRKVWLAYEIVSSMASIAINAADLDERTEYKQAVMAFQVIQAISGVSELGYGAFKDPTAVMNAFAKAPATFMSQGSKISKQTLYNCLKAIDNLEKYVKSGGNISEGAKATCASLFSFKEKIIADWPKLFGTAYDATKLVTSTVLSSAYQNTFDWFKGITKSNISAFGKTDFVIGTEKLAHVGDDQILVLDKVLDASTDGEVVDIIQNAVYRKSGSVSDQVQDLMLVRKSDGTMGCIEGACFAAGTLVKSRTGYKPIEKISENDSVWSYDGVKKAMVWSKVTRTFRKTTEKFIRVITGKDTILATPEHPFLSERGWKSIGSLTKGAKVKLAAGVWASILSVQPIDTQATVYNFEVEKTHTYTVGKSELIVHNSCKDADDLFHARYNVNKIDDLVRNPSALSKVKSLLSRTKDYGELKSWVLTHLSDDVLTKLNSLSDNNLSLLNYDFVAKADLRTWLASNPKLFDSWVALADNQLLRTVRSNLETVEKAAGNFTAGTKTGLAAITDIVKGNPSAQNYLDNLKFIEDFISSLPGVKVIGTKGSDVIRIYEKDGVAGGIDIVNSVKYKLVNASDPRFLSTEFLKNFEFQFGDLILKANQVRPGTNGKIAIVGRAMGGKTRIENGIEVRDYGVMDYSRKLRCLGYETFLFVEPYLSEAAKTEISKLVAENGGKLLSTEQIKKTLSYQENQAWINKVKDEGYTVIDIGDPLNKNDKEFSAFYALERFEFFGDVLTETK